MKCGAITLVLLALAWGAFPCSIFRYTVDGRTYFCGNEDWTATDPAIQTIAPTARAYGCVLFGWRSFLPRYVQAGINSKGLCFDWAAVPPQEYSHDDARRDLGLDFTVDVLKKCASVDEALAFIQGYNIPHLAEEHIMFADATGKSVVLEYNHSRLHVLPGKPESQFMTNFHLADTSLGWYPCARYSRMESFFQAPGSKESRLVDLLDGVHQEGPYPTVYSYVFDLNGRRITVFRNHNYRVKAVFSLDQLLGRDQSFEIKAQ